MSATRYIFVTQKRKLDPVPSCLWCHKVRGLRGFDKRRIQARSVLPAVPSHRKCQSYGARRKDPLFLYIMTCVQSPRAPFPQSYQTRAPQYVDPRRVRDLVTTFVWPCRRPGRCSGLPHSAVGMGMALNNIPFDTTDSLSNRPSTRSIKMPVR